MRSDPAIANDGRRRYLDSSSRLVVWPPRSLDRRVALESEFPFLDAYWVSPGQIMAGEYPGAGTPDTLVQGYDYCWEPAFRCLSTLACGMNWSLT